MFVIKDTTTGEYFRRRAGRAGWYGSNPADARFYASAAAADRVIQAGGHHVTYPGGRSLNIVPVSAVEEL